MNLKIIVLTILIIAFISGASATNVSLYSADPYPLPTNYTGILTASYIVESDAPLNYTTLAFLAGINHTLTDDHHAHIKVPANDIASEGIYRAHFRNVTPALLWESNTTLTGGNVWQWSGYDNNSGAMAINSINATHTWINVTGHTSIVFPSMFYLSGRGITSAPMTGIEINRAQGIIFKVWDVEHLRGRNNEYYVNLFFDGALEDTPNANIDLWYCNSSFNPNTDDPVTCEFCNRMDTWSSTRWMNKTTIQFHSNSSYTQPLTVNAGEHPDTPPDVINYIYLTSSTVSSKAYILNATNYDPNVCNLSYAQTNVMWLRNEISGTNTPYAYTPSFYMTFVRDFLEFDYSLHVADTNGVWGQNYTHEPIGLSNILPTYCKFNYYHWDNETDYNMTGVYTESFWINLTYGFDPDNDAPLSHVLSLYDENYNLIQIINDSLVGDQIDVDIWFEMPANFEGVHQFQIISTDNEGTSATTWSYMFGTPKVSSLLEGTTNFFDEMTAGLIDFKNDFDKYLVWGVIFVMCFLAFTIFGVFIKLLGGK